MLPGSIVIAEHKAATLAIGYLIKAASHRSLSSLHEPIHLDTNRNKYVSMGQDGTVTVGVITIRVVMLLTMLLRLHCSYETMSYGNLRYVGIPTLLIWLQKRMSKDVDRWLE
jgi:hypothetical protein